MPRKATWKTHIAAPRPGVRPVPRKVLLMAGLMAMGLVVMTAGVIERLLA